MANEPKDVGEAQVLLNEIMAQKPIERMHLGKYASMLEEYRELRVRREKRQQELNKYKMGIERATEANAKTLNYCEKKEKQLQVKEQKHQLEKSFIESALDIWRRWGLELEILGSALPIKNVTNEQNGDGDAKNEQENAASIERYVLKFTKIDPKRPEKVYSAQVEMHRDHIKILHVDPENLLGEEQIKTIEQRLRREVELSANAKTNTSQNSTDDDESPNNEKDEKVPHQKLNTPDFRLLAVLLRKMFRTCVSLREKKHHS